MPNCPQLRAEPYANVAHTSVRPAEATGFCLICGVVIALARMRNHVAVHLQSGEVVVDPSMRGEAEPCGFCGCSTGTCTTSIVRKKISSACPFLQVFWYLDGQGNKFSTFPHQLTPISPHFPPFPPISPFSPISPHFSFRSGKLSG